MARLVTLAFGANLLMQTMCRAKATAQQRMRTSPGPKTKLNSLSIEMRVRPMIERDMPTIAARAGFWRRKKKEKIGTRGTDMPVIKPALLTDVYCKPMVWQAYHV